MIGRRRHTGEAIPRPPAIPLSRGIAALFDDVAKQLGRFSVSMAVGHCGSQLLQRLYYIGVPWTKISKLDFERFAGKLFGFCIATLLNQSLGKIGLGRQSLCVFWTMYAYDGRHDFSLHPFLFLQLVFPAQDLRHI